MTAWRATLWCRRIQGPCAPPRPSPRSPHLPTAPVLQHRRHLVGALAQRVVSAGHGGRARLWKAYKRPTSKDII